MIIFKDNDDLETGVQIAVDEVNERNDNQRWFCDVANTILDTENDPEHLNLAVRLRQYAPDQPQKYPQMTFTFYQQCEFNTTDEFKALCKRAENYNFYKYVIGAFNASRIISAELNLNADGSGYFRTVDRDAEFTEYQIKDYAFVKKQALRKQFTERTVKELAEALTILAPEKTTAKAKI